MKRRKFLVASLLASTSLSGAGPVRSQQPISLIYVGGWDCGPCTLWKNNRKASWLASRERKQVNYIEIESPKLKEAYQDRYWPQELRPVRDQLKDKWGTPRFIIVKDGKVVASEWGNGDWDRAMAKLQALLG